MATVSVLNMEGKEVGTIELNDAVFGAKVNEHLVHMAVLQYLANKRQGTQKAKTRSEVSGGGRKPWRQKGTGHARQGSTRSPQWKGGGVVFAPTPRDYSFKLNKKEKAAAMKSALTSRVQENKIYVIDELALDEIKTKKMVAVLKGLNVEKALIITDGINENVRRSAGNIPNVKTGFIAKVTVEEKQKVKKIKKRDKNKNKNAEVKAPVTRELVSSTLNVYDILKYNNLVITKAAVELIEEVYA
ncbi:MAG: 50S ribosomal protein L4 [Lachnospiraceae bacterium]|nr:50S ribosomal protein L4 [Lachnospiraceae bacterium]